MKRLNAVFLAAGLASLAACNNSAREQKADNIEENAEAVADNIEDTADGLSNDAAADALDNKADAVRDTGQKKAEDVRTNDPDTNLANGL